MDILKALVKLCKDTKILHAQTESLTDSTFSEDIFVGETEWLCLVENLYDISKRVTNKTKEILLEYGRDVDADDQVD